MPPELGFLMKQAIKQNFVGVVITVFLFNWRETRTPHSLPSSTKIPFCRSEGHMRRQGYSSHMRREFNVQPVKVIFLSLKFNLIAKLCVWKIADDICLKYKIIIK